jgi:myo-inositol-1(or 4)-monophosphatase
MARTSPLLNVMIGAAEKAGRALVRDFGEVEQLQVSRKGPADFVSNADTKAEKVLREELQRVRPNYGLLMEESGEEIGPDRDSRWIVDPLDGTTNFLHGIPHFAVSVALEQYGELVAGVIYNPVHDELYFAEKGQGAYIRATHAKSRRLRVSGRGRLADSLIGTGIPFLGRGSTEDHETFLRTQAAVMGATAGIRRIGVASLDLAFVASGRLDGFWEFGLSPWDIAAGIVLVREAGGYVTGIEGRPIDLADGDVLAANDQLHGPLRKLLAEALRGDQQAPGRASG